MPNVRPRYSLLTLLVLTALVAGGVKLWRGPHHAVVSGDTRTAEERKLFTKFPLAFPPSQFNLYGEFRYEYSYLQHWNEREYLQVRMFPQDNKRFPLVQVNAKANARYDLLPEPFSRDLSQYALADPHDLEYLHHVCYLPQSPERFERPADSNGIASFVPVVRGDVYPLYYLSTKGHVYKTTLSHIVLSLVRMDLKTLPANVREALQLEITAALQK